MTAETGTETMTIERAVLLFNNFHIDLTSTKDAIKTGYRYIRVAVDESDFKAIKMNEVKSIFETYKGKHTKIKLEENDEKECQTLLDNNISNYIISTEWLDCSKLTTSVVVPAKAWREINAPNGDSFYVCFVYLLFSEVIIRDSARRSAIQFDIMENFRANMKEEKIDLKETQFVLKKIEGGKMKHNVELFDEYFNTFKTFVQEMTLYIRYCLYRCTKDSLKKSLEFLLEEETEPFPREEIFELLSKLFEVNLTVKFSATEQGIQKGSGDKQFCILHFGGRYHLYSTDETKHSDGTLHNNLMISTANIYPRDQKKCNCPVADEKEKIIYQSIYNSLVCRKCLETHVFTIMTRRIELYCKSNKYNKEMYLSPIYVNEHTAFRDVALSNVFQFQPEYQSYLSQVFETILKRFCCKCKTFIKNEEDITTTTCGCTYDKTCAKSMIIININNLFLQNCRDLDSLCVEFKCHNCKQHSSFTCAQDDFLTDEQKENTRKLFISYCISCKVTISSKVVTPFNENNQPDQLRQRNTNYKCQLQEDKTVHNKLFSSYYHFLCSECSKYLGEGSISKCVFCHQSHRFTKEPLRNERSFFKNQ